MEATAPERYERWAEHAYEAIAPVYDDFTAHHDYELWLGNLLPELRRHGLREEGRLLDVGCGTGKSFLPMLERGWEVTGCDISASMLARAQAKAGAGARLLVADMRELPPLGEFDLVWALDDAVNYLLSGVELGEALAGMRANLAPGGLLTFDVNTLHSYRTFFAETQVVESDGLRLIWRGQAAPDVPPCSICESRFEVEAVDSGEGAGNPIETHLHRQRHFPEAEVLELLEGAGLVCLDVFGHGFDAVPQQPLDELEHTKAVYIARRA
ncbi:MAG TPA: methyltransferase domain-containing protein [Solirubrobacterales bacterium]|nr:methyltransferase domain-containing protein [Solirubrobacterales bacterium]